MPRAPQGATLGHSGSSAFVEHETDIAGAYIFVPTALEDAGYRRNPFDRTDDEPAVQRVAIVSGVVAIPQDEEATIFIATPVADWITLSFDPRAKLVAWAEIALDVKLGKDDEVEPSVIIGRPVWMEIRTWEKQGGGWGAGIKQPQALQPGVAIPGVLDEFIRDAGVAPPPFVWLDADEVERRRERALKPSGQSNDRDRDVGRPTPTEENPDAWPVAKREVEPSVAQDEEPAATTAHVEAVQALASVLQAVLEEEFSYHADATDEDKLASLAAFWVYFNDVPTIVVGKSDRGGFRITPGTFTEDGARAAIVELERWDRGRGDDIRAQPFVETEVEAEPVAESPGLPE